MERQLQIYHVVELAKHASHFDVLYSYTKRDFFTHYRPLINAYLSLENPLEDDKDSVIDRHIVHWIEFMQWTDRQIRFGKHDVWLSFDIWRVLENQMRSMEKEARQREKERLAAIAAEKEAARQTAIAAALEAEVLEASQKAVLEAEEATKTEILSTVLDSWPSEKRLYDDDCRSDISNDDDLTEIDTQFNNSGRKIDWDEDAKHLAEG